MATRKIPAREGHGEYSEKRSRFLGTVYRVTAESEVSAVIAALRREHYEARHVVHAFVLADGTARFSDDGEPHGTAGKPLMTLLTSAGLTDCMVTVVRYFGGTLLGTGGLVRAYTEAARLALADAGIAEVRDTVRGTVRCGYEQYESLTRLLASFEGSDTVPVFADEVTVSFSLPTERRADFEQALAAGFAGKRADFSEN